MSTNETDWLTVTEAALAVGYHRKTVQDLAASGAITTRKRTFGYEVYMPSLREYIEASELRGPQPGRKNKDE